MSADWTCACRAVNSTASVYCEACNAERPNRRHLPAQPIPETHAPAKLPTYPELTPEEQEAGRAAIAAIKAMLGATAPASERPVSPRGLPVIDPRIRADVERKSNQPQRIGELLKLPTRRQ